MTNSNFDGAVLKARQFNKTKCCFKFVNGCLLVVRHSAYFCSLLYLNDVLFGIKLFYSQNNR